MCPLGLLGSCLSGYGFVLGGRWNALCVQFLCNLCAGLASNHFHENTADYRSCFHVDDKVMLVSRIGFIPVWDGVHKLCLLLFHSQCRLDLLGQVFAVIVIDKVLEGNIHTDSLAFMFRAVIMVIDRLEADAEKREDMLQIVTNFKIVSPETGKVFHYDAANFSMLCALYHLCKVRTIKVCAGETIITELYTRQIAEKRILIQMTIDEHTLGFEILYIFDGVVRKYLPDFLIRLDNRKTLILETKGQETRRDKEKRKALSEWVAAVNSLGEYGEWCNDVSYNIADVEGIIAKYI